MSKQPTKIRQINKAGEENNLNSSEYHVMNFKLGVIHDLQGDNFSEVVNKSNKLDCSHLKSWHDTREQKQQMHTSLKEVGSEEWMKQRSRRKGNLD